ncbi:MAG: hypothetical protein ABSG94_11255, partial [Brevinematales bacterium]
VILDFDGVISKNAMDIILDFTYDFVNSHAKIPKIFIENYVKNLSAFNAKAGVELVLSSLGLAGKIDKYFSELGSLVEYKGMKMSIEEDFWGFMKFCEDNGIICRFFSMAERSWARLGLLGEFFKDRYFFKNIIHPKSNPVSFYQLKDEIGIPLEKLLLVDDSPLALWSAKTAGLKTAFMANNVFKGSDYKPYREVIDYRINSFNELKKIFICKRVLV